MDSRILLQLLLYPCYPPHHRMSSMQNKRIGKIGKSGHSLLYIMSSTASLIEPLIHMYDLRVHLCHHIELGKKNLKITWLELHFDLLCFSLSIFTRYKLCWCSFDKISWKNLHFSVDSFADDAVGFIKTCVVMIHPNGGYDIIIPDIILILYSNLLHTLFRRLNDPSVKDCLKLPSDDSSLLLCIPWQRCTRIFTLVAWTLGIG